MKYSNAQEFAAFQIKLDSLGMSLDDPLEINIYHKRGCKPKVLNQTHQYQRSKLEITNINIENDSLSWIANENIPGRFEIQVYRWNKWFTIDSVQKPIKDTSFSFSLKNELHSGSNKLRICFFNSIKKSFCSKEMIHDSSMEEISYSIDKKTKTLNFSTSNRFEIYNEYGLLIKRGKGSTVKLNRLPSGLYYLNLDNRNVEIKFKN